MKNYQKTLLLTALLCLLITACEKEKKAFVLNTLAGTEWEYIYEPAVPDPTQQVVKILSFSEEYMSTVTKSANYAWNGTEYVTDGAWRTWDDYVNNRYTYEPPYVFTVEYTVVNGENFRTTDRYAEVIGDSLIQMRYEDPVTGERYTFRRKL